MIQKIAGFTFVLIAVFGWFAAYQGQQRTAEFIDSFAMSLTDVLQRSSNTLDHVEETLGVAKQTVEDLSELLTTVEATAVDVSATIEQAQPLMEEATAVLTEDVPGSIQTLQESLPTLVEVAGVVDRTLSTLNRFQIDRNILSYNFQFDLGIDYNPDVPFDQAMLNLSHSLDGLPETLQGLETELTATQANLAGMGENLNQLGSDIGQLNQTITETRPLLDEYIRITIDTNDQLRLNKQQVTQQATQMKELFKFIFIWMALFQLIPLYLGLDMLWRKRPSPYLTPEAFAQQMAVYQASLPPAQKPNLGQTDGRHG